MHPKNLSNIAKNTLDIFIVNDGPTPLGRVLKWLLEDLTRDQHQADHYVNHKSQSSVSYLNND